MTYAVVFASQTGNTRRVAEAMLKLCRGVLPELFDTAGARCERLGYCPEGARFTCGRYPLPQAPEARA